ncbi:MAG: hypothetical protein L0G99_06930 [Propionibacteriales bacterium]|nr:hypothetical protein [Propionibacteriales bacterium]
MIIALARASIPFASVRSWPFGSQPSHDRGHRLRQDGSTDEERDDMTTRLGAINVDCLDVQRQAKFWSAVLDLQIDPAPDPEVAEFVALPGTKMGDVLAGSWRPDLPPSFGPLRE